MTKQKKTIRIAVRLKVWQKYLALALLPFVAGVALYIVLTGVPSLSRWLLKTTSSAQTSNALEMTFNVIAFTTASLFCLAVLFYVFIDYKLHARPLKIEDPYAPYTLRHHTKVVIVPLVRYKKKQLSFAITYPLVTLLVLGMSASFSLQRVFASIPIVTTTQATLIEQNTAKLNGSVSAQGDDLVQSRGFEYGVSDSYGQSVEESVDQAYSYTSKFGVAGSSLGYTVGTGVTVTSSGNRYVLDQAKHRVIKFNSSGNYIAQWGGGGPGLNGSGTEDGEFSSPQGITANSANDIFVADTGNNRIQKFDADGNYITQWGSYGSGNGQMSNPNDTSVCGSTVYVSDTGNNRIQKFDADGNYQSQISGWSVFNEGIQDYETFSVNSPLSVSCDSNGNVSVLHYDYNGDPQVVVFDDGGTFLNSWGSYGSGNGQMDAPAQIRVNDSYVFVADTGNNRIQKFDADGNYITQWGSYGSGNGQFGNMENIAITATQVYALDGDTDGGRLQEFGTDGAYIDRFSVDDPMGGKFNSPDNIFISSDGSIFVADTDNGRIQKFDADGNYITQWGDWGDDSDGKIRHLYVRSIATDSQGNVYVVDSGGHDRIVKYDADGNYITQWGSYGSGEGQFQFPDDIAIDAHDHVYVADHNNNRIQVFSSSGVLIRQWSTNAIGNPSSISIRDTNNIFVALNSDTVARYDEFGQLIESWNSNLDDSLYSWDQNVEVSDNGVVFVADSDSNTITKFTDQGELLSTIGSGGSGDGQLNTPMGMAIDDDGNIVVADSGNNRIQIFEPQVIQGNYSISIGGLQCGTTYHFRAFATNGSGTSYGLDQEFTTAACIEALPDVDIAVTQELVSSKPVKRGSGVQFKLNLTNNGPDSYYKDELFIALPKEFSYVSMSTPYSCTDLGLADGLSEYSAQHFSGQHILQCTNDDQNLRIDPGTRSVLLSGTAMADFVNQKSENVVYFWNDDTTDPGQDDMTNALNNNVDFRDLQTNNLSIWVYSYVAPGTTSSGSTNPTNNSPPTNPAVPNPAAVPPVTDSPTSVGTEEPLGTLKPLEKDKYPKQVKGKAAPPVLLQIAPFFFLSLLLLLALMYALKSWQEYRRSRAIKILIERNTATSENIQFFLQIIAHYLNTPIAILQSSLELFRSDHTISQSLIESLYSGVKDLGVGVANMQHSAQVALDDTQPLRVDQRNRINLKQTLRELAKARFIWVPLLCIAILVATLDIVLVAMGKYRFESFRIANHAILFGLFLILLLGIYWLHNHSKRIHKAKQDELLKEQMLLAQKHHMLSEAASEIQHYYNSLKSMSDEFRNIAGTQTYFNGLTMLLKLSQNIGAAQLLTVSPEHSPSLQLSQILAGVLQELTVLAGEKNIRFECRIPNTIFINATNEQAKYILFAPLENAIKYSSNNSSILVSASQRGNTTSIIVKDSGSGIASDYLHTLFKPFSRASSAETYDQKNLGLGLYNTKMAVESLGGTISIKSKKGNGTVVTIKLPAIKQAVGQQSNVITPTVFNHRV